MSSPVAIDLFAEDQAQETILRPLIARVACEQGKDVVIQVRAARGGHPNAIREFKLYQDLAGKGLLGGSIPDILVVAIDSNCTTFAKKQQEIRRATSESFVDRVVPATPDPHVERWYLADPESFALAVGAQPTVGKKKCAQDHYKSLLAQSVHSAGHPTTLGGIEFAREIVDVMDLFRAGKNDRSFKVFVEDLRARLRRLDDRSHEDAHGSTRTRPPGRGSHDP